MTDNRKLAEMLRTQARNVSPGDPTIRLEWKAADELDAAADSERNEARKKIHSVDISFRISKLPRKQPSAILGGRDYGEENATQRQTRRIREALAKKKGKRK